MYQVSRSGSEQACVGDGRPETGDRRRETGDRRRETGLSAVFSGPGPRSPVFSVAGLVGPRSAVPGPRSAGSVLTQRTVHLVDFASFDRSISIVTIVADCCARSTAVLEGIVLVKIMAAQASWKVRSVHRYIANVSQYMAVTGIETLVVGL